MENTHLKTPELPKGLQIYTSTVLFQLNTIIDLSILIEYFQPNEKIRYIKWGRGEQEKYKYYTEADIPKKQRKKELKQQIKKIDETKQFYNQITVVVDTGIEIKDRKTNKILTARPNIFIFKNGALKLSGCKSLEIAVTAIKILIEEIYISGYKDVKLTNYKGLLLDIETNKIYSNEGNEIGRINYDDLTSKRKKNINKLYLKETGKVVEIKNNYLIDEEYEELKKNIYTKNGKKIGEKYIKILDNDLASLEFKNKESTLYASIKFKSGDKETSKRKKLHIGKKEIPPYSKKYEEKLNLILDKNTNNKLIYVGKEKIKIQEKEFINNNDIFFVKLFYESFDENAECRNYSYDYIIKNIRMAMINTDFSCGYRYIDKDFVNLVKNDIESKKYNIKVSYNKDTYIGIKLSFYPEGRCHCKKTLCKCKITITCFTSGSITITGAKSFNDTFLAYKYISNLFNKNKNRIQENQSEIEFDLESINIE